MLTEPVLALSDTVESMLGVHFAITAEQERALLVADDLDDVDAIDELLSGMEEFWAEDELKVDTDKAWDAIHRSLTDGTLGPSSGQYPLSPAIIGGRHLHDDYYAVYVNADHVQDIAKALHEVDREGMRLAFDAIDGEDYAGALDDEDFEYTWSNFVDVRAFYDRAATARRAVVFTAK
ncbi:YfbM family protein [Nocardia yamanashiensis]|uniref:YfbM family protein n=1 Tax=Nocardia yamanashiensis TaxID=209247 RepID=UPI001F2CBF45|nr:YfbM family protein [Nocardia yamanashiensis]